MRELNFVTVTYDIQMYGRNNKEPAGQVGCLLFFSVVVVRKAISGEREKERDGDKR